MARLVYVIEDTDGETFPVTIHISIINAATITTIRDTVMKDGWDIIRPLITGLLKEALFIFEANPEDLSWTNNIVDVLSDIQEKAKFSWAVVNAPDSTFRLTLPTIHEAILTNSGAGKIVDITDSDVAAFIAYMETDGSPISIVDSHGFTLGSLQKAYQWFGKG